MIWESKFTTCFWLQLTKECFWLLTLVYILFWVDVYLSIIFLCLCIIPFSLSDYALCLLWYLGSIHFVVASTVGCWLSLWCSVTTGMPWAWDVILWCDTWGSVEWGEESKQLTYWRSHIRCMGDVKDQTHSLILIRHAFCLITLDYSYKTKVVVIKFKIKSYKTICIIL